MAALCPLEIYKRGMATVTLHHNSKLYITSLHGIGYGLGHGYVVIMRHVTTRSSVGFESAERRAPFPFPPKKNMCFLVC
jgi:hypothetical protein